MRKLRGRVMPPAGRPRPDEATYDSLLTYLESSLDRAAANHPHPGRTDTFRRLTRAEYQNAIRDLLALDVDVSELLPTDEVSHGFDTAGAGTFSPTLLERYLAAAQRVSRLAVGSPPPSPASHVIVLPSDLTQEDHIEGLPFGTRGGTLVHHNFPLDGGYDIQVRLSRDRNENVEGLTEPHQLEVTLDGARAQLFTIKPNRNQSGTYYADEAVDRDLKLRLSTTAGPHTLGVTFLRKPLRCPRRAPAGTRTSTWTPPRIQPAVYTVSSPDRSIRAPPTRQAAGVYSCAGLPTEVRPKSRRAKADAPGPSSPRLRGAIAGP